MWRTARAQTASSVNRVRCQSQLQPICSSWPRMRVSYSFFQAQMRSTRPSRPRSWRLSFLLPAAAARRPLAWRCRHDRCRASTARCSLASACQRIRMSCSVLLSACPRCSAPVTFGGGMTIVNGLRADRARYESSPALSKKDTSGCASRGRIAWAARERPVRSTSRNVHNSNREVAKDA